MRRLALVTAGAGILVALVIRTAERLFLPLVIDSQTIDHEAILTIIRADDT